MIRRRREAEDPQRETERALLSVLGVTEIIPVPATGHWVYGLRDRDGVTFYVGKSASLLWRLGNWQRTYGETLAGVWLVRCRDEWQMSVTEDFLIDRLQPAMNVHGMSDELERIRERTLRKSNRHKEYWAARHAAEGAEDLLRTGGAG